MQLTTSTCTRGLLFGALLFPVSLALAQEKQPHVKNGIYLGVAVPHITIAGSFDGESALTGGGEFIVIPKVVSNFGQGALVGGRTGRSALELSFLRSQHNATFLDLPVKVRYHALTCDVRYYLVTESTAQPFVLLGATLDWLTIKGGSMTATEIGDAVFQGGGFCAGGGLAIYFHPRVSISGEAVYRLIGYGGEHSVKGVQNKWMGINDKDFSGDGMNLTLGLRLTL